MHFYIDSSNDYLIVWLDNNVLLFFLNRPHLFEYNSLLQKDPNTRLSHAFELAFRHLNIAKLLDPEGDDHWCKYFSYLIVLIIFRH